MCSSHKEGSRSRDWQLSNTFATHCCWRTWLTEFAVGCTRNWVRGSNNKTEEFHMGSWLDSKCLVPLKWRYQNFSLGCQIANHFVTIHRLTDYHPYLNYNKPTRCSSSQSILFYCNVYSTCSGCFPCPSSGVHWTVSQPPVQVMLSLQPPSSNVAEIELSSISRLVRLWLVVQQL